MNEPSVAQSLGIRLGRAQQYVTEFGIAWNDSIRGCFVLCRKHRLSNGFGKSMQPSSATSMSEVEGGGLRLNHDPWGGVELRRWPWPRGFRIARFERESKNLMIQRLLPRIGSGNLVLGVELGKLSSPDWRMLWKNWSNREREVIQCRRCGGPVKVPAPWLMNCSVRDFL